MKRLPLRRLASLVNRASEWLVLLALLAAAIPPVLIRHALRPGLDTLNLLDGSWLLDLSYKASGGTWLGRNVAFTYGPLFQWLSSAPARWIGISTGTVYATWYTLPLLLIVIATFFTVRLLLPEAAPWRRALLVLLAVVFWSPPDVRISLCLLAFAIFLRLAAAVASGKSTTLAALAGAAICMAAFWLSADTGFYTVAALLLCVTATAIVTHRASRTLSFIAIAAVFFGALLLVTNAALFSLWDFQYWRSSFAIAGGYRWFEAFPMAKADKHLVLESLALGIAVFAAAWFWRKADGTWTRRPAFLLSGFCLAFVVLQSALVRSDHGHIIVGISPLLFLCGAIVIDECDTRLWSIALPAAVVVATVALASPLYTPAVVRSHWQQVLHPELTCPADMVEFDHTCFSPPAGDLLADVSAYVQSQTRPGDPIAVFPYETAFGLASRRQVAGGVLQSYLVNGAYLTGLELAGLRRSNPPFALYFPDGQISVAVDEVPNFTRSPDVWFYLLQHYRADASPSPGVLGLVRDDTREGQFRFHEAVIADPAGTVPIRHRRTQIQLALQDWPAFGADFVRLRLKVDYPVWWRLRKPSKLTLEFSFDDGTDKSITFLTQPGHLSDVWIYPWDAATMACYFYADGRPCRQKSRPAVTDMKLVVHPYDWISVIPSTITVEKIEAVTMETEGEPPISQQNTSSSMQITTPLR
ncbi:MAG TPA: hypothetical protein VMD98_08190 [Bryocella sp.]|nr:hypothetical protein [Bryocella sp.]